MAHELDDAALRSEVAVQDGEAAGGSQRPGRGHDHLLPRLLLRGLAHLGQRAALDVDDAFVHEPAAGELASDESDAARAVEVGGDETAARLQVGEHRRAGGDRVDVVEGEWEVQLPRDREQVEHAVRGAAGGGEGDDRVLECLPRDDRRRSRVVADQIEHKPSRLLRGRRLRGVERGNVVRARGADPEELEQRRHRVRRELAAAGASAWTGDALELVDVGGAHLPHRVRSHRLEHVLDRHVATPEPARRDRASVEHESWEVEARERHHRRRDRLVAPDQADETVEEVAARDQLDRVGDHLARDERGAHSLRAHGDPVRDGDRVELQRRPAGSADAPLDVLREPALVQVARHRLDPRRRDTYQRTRQRVVVEACALQHRARRGPLDAVGERGAPALGRVGRAVVRRAAHLATASCRG